MKAGPPQSKPQGAGKPQERTREDESPMANEKLDGQKKEKKKWVWDAPQGYDLKRDLDTKTINSLGWMKDYRDPDGKKMTNAQIDKSYDNFEIWFDDMIEQEETFARKQQVQTLLN